MENRPLFLMNLANEVSGVSSARMQNTLTTQIDKVNQNPTAQKVGQLYATVQTANNQANAAANQVNTVATQAEVAENLKGRGIPSWKIDTLAEAIVRRVYDQKLTQTQREILSFELGRPVVQRVINDLIQKKANGVDSAQNDVYDDSIREGRTNEASTTSWNLSNQGVDGSLLGTLAKKVGSPRETFSSAQHRGLTSEVDVFGDNNYAIAMGDSSYYQGQRMVSEGGLDASFRTGDGSLSLQSARIWYTGAGG